MTAERTLRLELLAELDQLSTPADLWNFQRRLIDEIIAVEPRALGERDPDARRHLRCLRAFGDALAWRSLHGYSIRQLAKNPAPRPALYNQIGLALTIETAEAFCTAGIPALIADLTNCLTVSDVIVCADPERPVELIAIWRSFRSAIWRRPASRKGSSTGTERWLFRPFGARTLRCRRGRLPSR